MDAASTWRRQDGVGRGYARGPFGPIHRRLAQPASDGGRVPVMFVHASPSSGRMFDKVVAELGRDRMAFAGDTPGFGDSAPTRLPPSIADYAAAHGALADALGATRVDVVGVHTGSKVAVELALQRPALVRRLVLVSAPVYDRDELARQLRDYADPGIPRDGAHMLARWRFLVRWHPPGTTPWLLQRAIAETLRAGPRAHLGHAAAFAYHHADNLPALHHPVLVVNPGDDLQAPTARAAPLLRNGRIVAMPGWAHGFADLDAHGFAALLRGFLDGPAEDLSAFPPPRAAKLQPAARPEEMPRHDFVATPLGLAHVAHARPRDARGRPLVLLHRFPLSSRVLWEQMRLLAQDRPVLAPDAPGCGESDMPPAPLSIEEHAAHLEGVLRGQGIDRCDVVGIGGGGVVARCLARRAPRLVAALALGASPCADEVEALPPEPRADGGHNVDAFLALQRLHGPEAPLAVVAREHAEALRGGPAAADGAAALRRARDAGEQPGPAQPALALDGPAHSAPGTEECARILRFLDGCTI